MRLIGLAGFVFVLIVGLRYPDNPPPAHTGGFGEPSCHFCHFENDLNAPGGVLTVSGLDDRYAPGDVFTVEVRLARAGMQRAGFELSMRYAEGDRKGEQAGVLLPTDERATVDSLNQILYIRHTEPGSHPVGQDSAYWRIRWSAPASTFPVALHLAANAANGDASEFGDSIYLLEKEITAR
jgi:hypothetical protein